MATGTPVTTSPDEHATRKYAWLRSILTRKIWLPKALYEALPALYAIGGIAAIFSTLFVSRWYWIVPFAWLLGLGCLHAAQAVWRMRRAHRRKIQEGPDTSQAL